MLVDEINKLADKFKFLVFASADWNISASEQVEKVSGMEREEQLRIILNSDFLQDYPYPLIINLDKVFNILKQKQNPSPPDLNKVLKEARFSLFGTDGIRGKVLLDSTDNPFNHFCHNFELTPALVELACRAFARLSLKYFNKVAKTIILGNDGRDLVTGWKLREAVKSGFKKENYQVLDLGVVPTPYIAWQMLKKEITAGAVLTASHNPANQNGLKFFLQGKKILPEGEIGDYSISALMYALYRFKIDSFPLKKDSKEVINLAEADKMPLSDLILELVSDTVKALPPDFASLGQNVSLIVDNANGAFFELAPLILNQLKIEFNCVNRFANGYNINDGCGVAELEGRRCFKRDSNQANLPAIVKELFTKGIEEKKVLWGLALDGDGDRGFLLFYDPETDTVGVLDGDRLGLILARYFFKEQAEEIKQKHYVLTVESDLMTAKYIQEKLGFQVAIVSVGDKWISHYSKAELLMGLEISGHLILPIKVTRANGKVEFLKTGNGLLTGLLTLYTILKNRLSPGELLNLFPEGFIANFPVYFVNKNLFYKNSNIWDRDCEILKEWFEEKQKYSSALSGFSLEFCEKEDPGLLYAAFYQQGKQEAAIFIRNSGTEDKNVVYLQCPKDLAEIFLPVIKKIIEFHHQTLKDQDRFENQLEKIILNLLKDKPLVLDKLYQQLEAEIKTNLNFENFKAVIHALKKEGLIFEELEVLKPVFKKA